MCKYDHRPQQSVYSTEIFQIWKPFLGAKYHHVGGRRNSTGTYLHTPHTRKQITEPSLGGLITPLTKAFRVNNECSEIISHGHFMSSMLTDCTRWPTASTHTDVAWQTDQCLTMPTISTTPPQPLHPPTLHFIIFSPKSTFVSYHHD